MYITLLCKFSQHRNLLIELLETGDAELIEVNIFVPIENWYLKVIKDSDRDAFWGVGPDGKGRNELGKCLERLRAELRRGIHTGEYEFLVAPKNFFFFLGNGNFRCFPKRKKASFSYN